MWHNDNAKYARKPSRSPSFIRLRFVTRIRSTDTGSALVEIAAWNSKQNGGAVGENKLARSRKGKQWKLICPYNPSTSQKRSD
jgi:hypothetical protein